MHTNKALQTKVMPCLVCLFPAQQLHIKQQSGIWWYDATSTSLAIAQLWRDDQLPFSPFLQHHEIVSCEIQAEHEEDLQWQV